MNTYISENIHKMKFTTCHVNIIVNWTASRTT